MLDPGEHGSHAKLPPVRRLHPANLRAAWWAIRTARRTRRLLAARGLHAALAPPPPPPLPVEAERGVRGGLRRWHESCLVNAIVLQAWEAAHGRTAGPRGGNHGTRRLPRPRLARGGPCSVSSMPPSSTRPCLNASPGEGWAEAPSGAERGWRGRKRRQRHPDDFQRALAPPRAPLPARSIRASPLSAARPNLYRIHGLLVESEIPLQAAKGRWRPVAAADAESRGATRSRPRLPHNGG